MKLKNRVTAFLSGMMIISGVTAVPAFAEDYQDMKDEIVMLINEERAGYGKSALYEAEFLNRAAQVRAEELTVSYAHTRPDGREPNTVFKDLGGSYWYFGENIAKGFSSEAQVMDAWNHSSGHHANILSDNYHAVGIGIAKKNNVYCWVQLFTDGEGLSPLYTEGNLNRDNACNAEDAALVLTHAAQSGAGGNGILNRLQKNFADINQDMAVNAEDAAMILQYAAYIGSGGEKSIKNYFHDN